MAKEKQGEEWEKEKDDLVEEFVSQQLDMMDEDEPQDGVESETGMDELLTKYPILQKVSERLRDTKAGDGKVSDGDATFQFVPTGGRSPFDDDDD